MKIRLHKLTTEPLLQFIALGVVIYVLAEMIVPLENGLSSNNIKVSEAALIKYMQFQNKRFDSSAAKEKWLSLSIQEREQLIEDYVRDEVLYREALALGLDRDDQIIRRRLTQKLDYVMRGFIEDVEKVSPVELERFFLNNQSDYWIDASITYTHVFISSNNRTEAETKSIALTSLAQLNKMNIPFDRAAAFSERFLFHRNYVDRTPDFVSSHFGESFSEQVFSAKAGTGEWQGPFSSHYGAHLVMITKNDQGRHPVLEEVAPLVLGDLRRQKLDIARKAALEEMIGTYSISRDQLKVQNEDVLAYVP